MRAPIGGSGTDRIGLVGAKPEFFCSFHQPLNAAELLDHCRRIDGIVQPDVAAQLRPFRAMQPTRAVLVVPGQDSAHIWSCCRWGLPCRPCHHGRGALLPHHFTLTAKAPHVHAGFRGGIFLLHFPSDHSALALPSTVPCAVRTFLTSEAVTHSAARSPLQPRRFLLYCRSRPGV